MEIIIDTSALLAVIVGEPERDRIVELTLKGAVGFAPLGDWGQRLRRKIKATSRFCPNR